MTDDPIDADPPVPWPLIALLALTLGVIIAVAVLTAVALVAQPALGPDAPTDTPTATPTPTETTTEVPTPTTTPVGTENDQVFCDDMADDGFECEPGMLRRDGSTVTPTPTPGD